MAALYPFRFTLNGMTQDYLWGGSRLKPLVPEFPADQPLAEIWTISDRPEDNRVSVIANGPLAGKTLRWLMETHADALLGAAPSINGKFPLLVKLLDAQDRLSLQVHPPTDIADELGGEPKTECWTFLDGSAPDAKVFVGLKAGVSRADVEQAIHSGSLEPLLHTVPATIGECMYLPSGRLHAIGAGCLILEIQANSNTTYRVFDWNRVDTRTGQPRDLHVDHALTSIDFGDTEPSLQEPLPDTDGTNRFDHLIDCPEFTLERWQVQAEQRHEPNQSFELITALSPLMISANGTEPLPVPALSTALIPASLPAYTVQGADTRYIRTLITS